ncbi:MAG: rRNA maturation RNase YbeY [Bacillus sp. (in: Bacteria)]|nr:rRNA maturation RNase YbeY [Bacillus sp. (in: firmicutes)]
MEDNQIGLMDETAELSEDLMELVGAVIRTAMVHEELGTNAEVSITFVGDEHIQQLNRDYRGKDQPTDVLSFALDEGDEATVIKGDFPQLLGDIIISVPRAVEQAKEYGHDINRELCFLAVHGFLHLIGYDHNTEEEEKAMFSKQEEILQAHGIKK